MPHCYPASSEFLRSSAYAVESSDVDGLYQYRESFYHHVQFVFHVEIVIAM